MTTPERIPPAVPFGVALPTWCSSCSIHMATTLQPLCPVCVDQAAREIREGK